MGGFGSGRGQGGKDTTSDMQTLDIRRLQRDGLLIRAGLRLAMDTQRRAGGVDPDRGHGSRPRDAQLSQPEQRRRLATDGIPCRSGMDGPCTLAVGGRGFAARRSGCGRRVAILYGGTGSSPVDTATIWSMRASGKPRTIVRGGWRRRSGSGWVGRRALPTPDGGKPKGMHWRTFERLTAAARRVGRGVAGRGGEVAGVLMQRRLRPELNRCRC
jgi:hypothetical protein